VNALALLFALAFLVSVDVRILAPVLPSISLSLDSTAGTVGLAMTSYAFAYGMGHFLQAPGDPWFSLDTGGCTGPCSRLNLRSGAMTA
jgi:MFS family permease